MFPAKYRCAVFDEAVGEVLRDVCLELERRYQLKLMEIDTDKRIMCIFWCSRFPHTVSQTGDTDQEHHGGAGGILLMSSCEETVVGRGILD